VSDLYYDPEKFGLEKVAELAEDGLSCEFHLLVVWREKSTGDLLWGEDSGCSCPSPFERQGVDDLSRSREDLRKALDAFPAGPLEKRAFRETVGLPL
jgi:hypothetical protein